MQQSENVGIQRSHPQKIQMQKKKTILRTMEGNPSIY